jgi:drug/metabolite transporter (DMT)-like permease
MPRREKAHPGLHDHIAAIAFLGAAVVALGALGAGVAYPLYFTLIARAGASRAILVTYLVPAFALVYGAVFLDEAVTATALAGLALILGGTALATGARLRRR